MFRLNTCANILCYVFLVTIKRGSMMNVDVIGTPNSEESEIGDSTNNTIKNDDNQDEIDIHSHVYAINAEVCCKELLMFPQFSQNIPHSQSQMSERNHPYATRSKFLNNESPSTPNQSAASTLTSAGSPSPGASLSHLSSSSASSSPSSFSSSTTSLSSTHMSSDKKTNRYPETIEYYELGIHANGIFHSIYNAEPSKEDCIRLINTSGLDAESNRGSQESDTGMPKYNHREYHSILNENPDKYKHTWWATLIRVAIEQNPSYNKKTDTWLKQVGEFELQLKKEEHKNQTDPMELDEEKGSATNKEQLAKQAAKELILADSFAEIPNDFHLILVRKVIKRYHFWPTREKYEIVSFFISCARTLFFQFSE